MRIIKSVSKRSCLVSLFQVYIQANGEKGAEMVTDQGAIYVTSNGGYNWRAAVQETVSATLNRLVLHRDFFLVYDLLDDALLRRGQR